MMRRCIDLPILDLKLPPSVNQLWRTGRGKVFRSGTYDAWRKEAGWELRAQRPPSIDGQVEISSALGCPDDNRRRDLDEFSTKALPDARVEHADCPDDAAVVSLASLLC